MAFHCSLVCVSFCRRVLCWDTEARAVLSSHTDHSVEVVVLSINTTDGCISGDKDGSLVVWNVRRQAAVRTLQELEILIMNSEIFPWQPSLWLWILLLSSRLVPQGQVWKTDQKRRTDPRRSVWVRFWKEDVSSISPHAHISRTNSLWLSVIIQEVRTREGLEVVVVKTCMYVVECGIFWKGGNQARKLAPYDILNSTAILIVDVETASVVRRLHGHVDAVNSMAWHPSCNGKLFAYCGQMDIHD